MKDSHIAYVFIALEVIALALAIFTLNFYLILLSSLIALLAFAVYKLWYIIENELFKHTGVIQLLNGYELSDERIAAVIRQDDLYSATAAAIIESIESSIDKDKLESIIAHLNVPFKLVAHIEKLNTKKLLEKMQTKKSMKEIELSKVGQSSGKEVLKANRLKTEIQHLEHELEQISSGGIPLKLVYYIMTSAFANSKYKAVELARAQLRDLTGNFDSVFNSKSRMLQGIELLQMLRFDSVMMIE